MKLNVYRCNQCETTVFPSRYLCPSCGSGSWLPVAAERGVVASQTTVRQRIATDNGGEVHFATVVALEGPLIVARLPSVVPPGSSVSLDLNAQNQIIAQLVES